jgi:diguanylate cyclase (GGDEF)-like protein/PAS domain S-box-containing protein
VFVLSAGNLQKKKKILLVKDSRQTINLFTGSFPEQDYETETVVTGAEAVQVIARGLPVDLVIIDMELTGEIDGIETARRILDLIDIPIIFLTSEPSGELNKRINNAKSYGVVLKSMGKAAMLSAAEMALKLHEVNAQLKKQKSTLNAILDSTRDGIIMLDGQGKVDFWNTAAEQISGYSREEVLGKELHRLVLPEEHAYKLYQRSFKYFQLTGKSFFLGKTIDLRIGHKDGRKIDTQITMSALKLSGAWYAVGVVREIGTRKQSQEELKKSYRDYLELAEHAPVGILKCDWEGNITYVNQRTLEILGSPDIEETKKINLFTFPLMIKYGLSSKLESCLQKNQPGTYEVNYVTKWGKKVWLRTHIKLLPEKGQKSGIQIIIDDITEKKLLEKRLLFLSVTDELTGAYNRRFIKEKLEEEKERSERSGNPFSVIMIDLDNFKKFNDCYGHNEGDLILKKIVQMFQKRIRKIDTLARWGGDEFIILLPNTTAKNAAHLAEELRLRLSQMHLPPGVEHITASFGAAGYRPGDTIETLVKRADCMMYQANNEGKNCVRYVE